MRRALAVFVLWALAAGSAAGEPPAPAAPPAAPRPPDSPAEAAAAVVGAVKGKDEAALRALAARDVPDPWLVADELSGRGELDAADAFARAAPRPDVARLPEHVASRRGKPVDEEARKALAGVMAAMRAGNAPEALAELDAAGKAPEDPVLACRLAFARGGVLAALRRLEESSQAYLAAFDPADRVGWASRAAEALHQAGASAFNRSDFRGALAHWERRLAYDEKRGNENGIAAGLGNVGVAHAVLGETDQALEMQLRAIAFDEKHGRTDRLAVQLGNIGNLYLAQGDATKAIGAMERSLALCDAAGDREGSAVALINLGIAHEARGDHRKAVEFSERALATLPEASRPDYEPGILNALGVALKNLGRIAAATSRFEAAMKAAERSGDRLTFAQALGNRGLILSSLGEYAQALDFHQRAFAAKEALGDVRGACVSLGSIADVHFQMGDLDRALSVHQKALEMAERNKDPATVSRELTNLGVVLLQRREYDRVLEYETRALAGGEAVGTYGVAVSQLTIAAAYEGKRDHAKAVEHARLALEGAERSGTLLLQQAAWAYLASFRSTAGEWAEAVAAARSSVELTRDLVRGQADEQQAGARAQVTDAFSTGARAAVRLGDVASVAYFLESARAGSLLEALGGRDALRDAVVPADLQAAEAEARSAVSAASLKARRASAESDPEAAAQSAAAHDRARSALRAVHERIQREAKSAASLVQPVPDALEAIQARLLPDQALVLFALLGPDVFAFLGPSGVNSEGEALALVVTAKGARVVPLGKVSEIEAAFAAYVPGEAALDAASVDALRRRVVQPLGLGADTKTVLVSPDGPLAYVPFALLDRGRSVAYVPSGTALGLLAAQRAPAGKGVLALGDPESGPGAGDEAPAGRRAGPGLERLPGAREEAKAVGDTVLLGAEATRSGLAAALRRRPRWRAVHLACHAFADAENPTFSRLLLAPDATGDGTLAALDVFRMSFPADLVVLSACETGKGKFVRKEGVLGLTRAFMFAGAPRVLVSLWRVDDRATRRLMEKFYELWTRQGVGAAAALAQAQEHVRTYEEEVVDPEASRKAGRDVRAKQRPFEHPRFWAAWVLWGLPD